MVLTVDRITKVYPRITALKEISFTVSSGELLTFIGPSGAGKTTLLKIIAGLETMTAGQLRFDAGPANIRQAIMVFQDFVLFPYMSVFENIVFGLKARKISKEEVGARAAEMLDFFNLNDMKNEFPSTLSSGQKQRVALARALVVRPRLLLLDEPFANLDKNLKLSTAEFIRGMQQNFHITTIAVTHDQAEAFAMSDRIGILQDGELKQIGGCDEIYNQPVSREIAEFLGPVNEITPELYPVVGIKNPPPGKTTLLVRAENCVPVIDPDGPAEVVSAVRTGALVFYNVEISGKRLKIQTLSDGIVRGDHVGISIKNKIWI